MDAARPETDADILTWLRREYDEPFVGWDFSYLSGRRQLIGDKPWDYESLVVERLATATAALDVDTGDGRGFANLLASSGYGGQAAATEGYPPNVPLARATLEPLGVDVCETTDERLPFADAAFDLVVNRHGHLDPAETLRVLRPGGWFVTQQVGSQTNLDIHRLLAAPMPAGPAWDAATARAALEATGFRVERAEEHFPVTRYADVGALVWYLKAIPWQIPDFSVDRFANRLLALHRRVQRTGDPIDVGFHQFVLVARR